MTREGNSTPFSRPPLETLPLAKDRWTPIYLEHGRVEVDDSAIKWVGADGTVCPLPVATITAVLLGPGTTVTHAAVKATSQCNCPIFWVGADGLRFYASGVGMNHDNGMARKQARVWATAKSRNNIARKMFKFRFGEEPPADANVPRLMGMEGKRVKKTYADLGEKYGVTWKGRNYSPTNWQLSDGINKAISAANASLYAMTAAVCCSMGFIPQLGFVHQSGPMAFVYDIADLYKTTTSMPAAFEATALGKNDTEELARKLLKRNIEKLQVLKNMPKDILEILGDSPQQDQNPH
ncbi:MAG: type I-E CRISPR-associated endonuclease Cas1e [Terrimicrobiaceae bacterium]